MSTSSEPASFPPWLSYLLEPAFAALDQARAEITQIGVQLMEVPSEHLAKLKTGPQKEPHPEDAAWLASEQARLAGLETFDETELVKLRTEIEAEISKSALLRIEIGDDPELIVKTARKTGQGLEGKIARYLRLFRTWKERRKAKRGSEEE